MTFYGTIASGAGWIVPKKYLAKVGVDAFKQHPVGLGPYKIVSHKPGVEIIAEAVVSLSPADKYHRFTRRLSQGQKVLQERALLASQRPSEPW
jgi:hypothetical protein